MQLMSFMKEGAMLASCGDTACELFCKRVVRSDMGRKRGKSSKSLLG